MRKLKEPVQRSSIAASAEFAKEVRLQSIAANKTAEQFLKDCLEAYKEKHGFYIAQHVNAGILQTQTAA